MSKIDFQQTFGQGAKGNNASAKADRPKAELWINIGYSSGVVDDDGQDRFVSLSQGIPLDTIEPLPTNSRNREYAAFQAARNNLHEQIMAAAAKLAPGEAKILNLEIQLRRVNEDAADIAAEDNQFAKQLVL